MFAPEMKIEKFEMVDVITTSDGGETEPACPTNSELPCFAD